MDSETSDALREMEESIWRADARFDDALMDGIFADDFCEFGRSGGVYRREDMFLGHLPNKTINATLPLRDFRVRALSEGIMHVMYVSEVRYGSETETSNRSSIWRRKHHGWELCFHQGTPTG